MTPTTAPIHPDSTSPSGRDQVHRHGGVLPLASIRQALDEDIVLVASDGLAKSVDDLARSDQKLAAEGRARLALRTVGDVVQIGPFLRPGQSGCVWCADRRHRSVLSDTSIDSVATNTSPLVADDLDRAVVSQSWTPILRLLARQVVARSDEAHPAQPRPVACLHLDDGTITWHRVSPVLQCPWCSNTSVVPQPGAFESRPMSDPKGLRCNPLPDVAVLESHLVDHRFGPVRRIYRDGRAPGALDGVEVAIPGVGRKLWGYGRSSNHHLARTVGLLEALERESGCTPQRRADIQLGSLRDLQRRLGAQNVIDPATLGLPDPQFDNHPRAITAPYSPDQPTAWVQGWAPLRGHHVWLPEHVAYYGAPDRVPGGRYLYECSNGAALGSNREEATVHGLFELLERDAFLLHWYSQTPLPPFDLDTLKDPEARLYLERARSEGYEVHLFDATSDVPVPVVQALVVNQERPEAVTFSTAGAHLDPQRAARAALLEVVVMILLQETDPGRRQERLDMLADPTLVRDMDDHVALFTLPESLPAFDYLLRGKRPAIAMPEGPWGPLARVTAPKSGPVDMGELATQMCQLMGAARMDPFVVDLSSELNQYLGLSVVKVLAAGAVPLTFGHVHHRTLGIARLDSARARNHVTAPPFPHPFP